MPQPPFEFVEELLTGSHPSVAVRDARQRLWRVKWGAEAKPEAFCVRFAAACGYFAEVTHYVATGRIDGAGALTRARSLVAGDGSFTDARFELEDRSVRMLFDEHSWAWNDNPFVGTRQLDGLKIVVMLLSNWDGFFNNHFVYHDVHGSGKWTMYPWDHDKTWGAHDGIRGYEVFFDMPLTFGMAGDLPPGWPKGQPPPAFFGAGPIWWRPGGNFSKPLLANPDFRKLFVARTKELLEKVYTEDVMFPKIKALATCQSSSACRATASEVSNRRRSRFAAR